MSRQGLSVIEEARQIDLAAEFIRLGARVQFLEQSVDLSRERLIKLYREIKGVSPPKGLLPFSTDWHLTWEANIHSSMFYNIYLFILKTAKEEPLRALITSYQLYIDQIAQQGGVPVLDFTRACTMIRFFDGEMLGLNTCTRCKGNFVAHAFDFKRDYVCVLCRPPSRAGKSRKSAPVDAALKPSEVAAAAVPA